MAKKFDELRQRMSPEARKRADELTAQLMAELPLQELRQARSLTQEQLARALGINQAAISKLERRADMYLSTLKSYINAMGGELRLIAAFPDGCVSIDQLAEPEEEEEEEEKKKKKKKTHKRGGVRATG
jgi:transcriptional regulator with XRE-family HTH domain